MESLKEQNEHINRLSVNMEDAIQSCLDCFKVCNSCMQHCLSLGGKHAEVRHISLMNECAEVCQLAAHFMIATSDFSHDICGICARVCDACADSCNEIDPEDPHMISCQLGCKKCADACRRMEH